MVAVANDALRHLRHQCLSVAQCKLPQDAVLMEFPADDVSLDSIGFAGTLHDAPVIRSFSAKHQRSADQSVIAGDGEFGRGAAWW